MAVIEITGNLQRRFLQDAVLLYMLDPVRGSPTAYGLDRHSHDADVSRENFLKRKFLDSFSLLASTHKDGDTVSAATLEEGMPEGTVVRIASNAGVQDSTLVRLQDLMTDLNDITATGLTSEKKTNILIKIISLDIDKIRHYFEKLRKVQSEVPEARNLASQLNSILDPVGIRKFSSWMENLAIIVALPADALPSQLLPHVLWAEKAKWEFSSYLEAFYAAQGVQLPPWIYNIYKIGRYAVASKAFFQLATEYPGLFCPMRIETVHPASKVNFSIPETEQPLSQVLRRVVGDREKEFSMRLARIWNVRSPDARFRRGCHLRLAVHAEMQLISFYDLHPKLLPSFRFMGVSKKSCFLCQRFLSGHPSSFAVSSCHQKLYLSWRPPQSCNAKTYKTYKSIITEMCKAMETTARLDLQSRMGNSRAIPLDSTAGVSLSGLTDYNPVSIEDSSNTVDAYETSPSEPDEEGAAGAPVRPEDDEGVGPASAESSGGNISSHPSLVFNVVRADNTRRRDIVSLEDIRNSSGNPSWRKLVEILSVGDRFGICFDEDKEFLLVTDSLRVGNARQFHACLQFLRNSDCYNANVTICAYASLDSDGV